VTGSRDASAPLRRVFLVGCPRSRTTVAQTVLSQVAGLVTTRSTNWWLEGEGTWLLNGPQGEPREVTRPFAVDRVAEELRRVAGVVLPPGFRVEEALDQLAVASGARGWLEKTPLHVLSIAEIESEVSGARFVHLVRGPEAVVASFIRRAAANPDMRGAAWQSVQGNCEAIWRTCAHATLATRGRSAHLVVDSEAFVADPEGQARRVADFLDLPYRAPDDPARAAVAAAARPSPRPWKKDAAGPVRAFEHRPLPLRPLEAETVAVWRRVVDAFGITPADAAEGSGG
jgi:hypothetical protein